MRELHNKLFERELFIIASMKLTGGAFKHWQDIKDKPKIWADFENKLLSRLGEPKVEQTTLYSKLLSQTKY